MKTLYIQYPSIVNLSIKTLRTAGGAEVRANDDGTFGPLLGNYQIEDNCTVTFVKTSKPDTKLDTSRAGLAHRRISIARDLRIPAYVAGTRWRAAQAYVNPDVAVLPSGDIAIVGAGGTSGATPPVPSYVTSPSAGITDNTVTWYLLGEGAQQGAVPVRANSTFYRAGTLVVLATGDLVRATVSGTTGASAPTYSATAAITDGTVTWYAVTSGDLDADEVLVTDNSGNPGDTTLYNPWIQPQLFTQPTQMAQEAVVESGSTSRHRSWVFVDGSTSNNGLGSNGKQPGVRNLLCKTESNVLDIGYFATDGSNEHLQVYDGNRRVFEVPLKLVAGSSRYLRVLIPGGRRRRVIRVAVSGQVNLRYVGVAPNCTVQPVDSLDPVVLLHTDSYNNTELPAIGNVHYDLSQQLGMRLGCPHVINVSCGGISYSVDSPQGRKNLAWVYDNNDLSVYKPDFIVNALGFNASASGTDYSQEATKALYVWRKQQLLFGQQVFQAIVGPWFERSGQEAQTREVCRQLFAAFLSHANPNSIFINPLDGSVTRGDGEVIVSASAAWVTATNQPWVVPSVGGVYDGAHVSIPGQRYLADCLAQAIDAGLANLGYGLSFPAV